MTSSRMVLRVILAIPLIVTLAGSARAAHGGGGHGGGGGGGGGPPHPHF
jgi:hypothetical protein